MKAVVQEHGLGCAVACVASLLGTSYKKALKLFSEKSHAYRRGYYCIEICEAIRKGRMKYNFKKITPKTKGLLKKNKVIVFISPYRKVIAGHFLLKTSRGWMNSWINFPIITPAKAGFQKKIPGKARWVIYPDADSVTIQK